MEKLIIGVNIHSLPIVFLRDIDEEYLLLKDADNKPSNFATELKNFDESIKTIDTKSFLNNLGLFFSAREKVPNNFKSRIFPIKNLDKTSARELTFESAIQPAPKPTPETRKAKTKRNISPLKLRAEFLNEIKV